MAGIAKLRAVVLDCPDPVALARFYGALVGGAVNVEDGGDWVTLRDGADVRLSFQRVDGFRPPEWPSGDPPQQFHIDVTVDEVDTAEKQVLALGATKHAVQPGEDGGENWRIYLDPAGHPFCLCWD
jgi:Glyoxalase-like domain